MILYCKKTEVENIGPIIDAISTAIYSIKPDCERLFRRMSFEERYKRLYVSNIEDLMPCTALSSYGEYNRIPSSEHTVFYTMAYNSMALSTSILVVNEKLGVGDIPHFGTEKFILQSIRDKLYNFPVSKNILITSERPYGYSMYNTVKIELPYPVYL